MKYYNWILVSMNFLLLMVTLDIIPLIIHEFSMEYPWNLI